MISFGPCFRGLLVCGFTLCELVESVFCPGLVHVLLELVPPIHVSHVPGDFTFCFCDINFCENFEKNLEGLFTHKLEDWIDGKHQQGHAKFFMQ